jgi:hypothetical protein
LRTAGRLPFWLLFAITLPGCGAHAVTGGTPGILHFEGKPLTDIQVTVHLLEGSTTHPVGFGVTVRDGSFKLVKNGAQGPLWLSPGEYCCTLESAGSPVKIPKQYSQPDTTPLKVSWSSSDSTLSLVVADSSAN